MIKRSGILLVNKPSGPTSYDIIRWIKRNLKGVKIGHCGTLDPLASGLLIILLGHATKKQSQFMGQSKTYVFRIKLGFQTDSGDVTGKKIQEARIPEINDQSLRDCLESFKGSQEQMPPMYSAIKHKGTPLYKLARKGKTVERKSRPIMIEDIQFVRRNSVDEFEVRTRCSSGTYIRTLAEDIGKKLGSCATMSYLVRESVGNYSLNSAISGNELKEMSADDIWSLCL